MVKIRYENIINELNDYKNFLGKTDEYSYLNSKELNCKKIKAYIHKHPKQQPRQLLKNMGRDLIKEQCGYLVDKQTFLSKVYNGVFGLFKQTKSPERDYLKDKEAIQKMERIVNNSNKISYEAKPLVEDISKMSDYDDLLNYMNESKFIKHKDYKFLSKKINKRVKRSFLGLEDLIKKEAAAIILIIASLFLMDFSSTGYAVYTPGIVNYAPELKFFLGLGLFIAAILLLGKKAE